MRRLLGLTLLFLALGCGIAHAQTPTQPQGGEKPAESGITAAQARSALQVLTNDAQRRELVSTLETIVKAQAAIAPAAPAPSTASPNAAAAHGATPAPAPAAPGSAPPGGAAKAPAEVLPQLLPGSLGDQLIKNASDRFSELESSVSVTARTVLDLPLLSYWFVHVVEDPSLRGAMIDSAWRLALVLIVAIGAEYGASRLLERPVRAVEQLAEKRRSPERGRDPDSETAASEGTGGGGPRRRHPSALTMLRRLPLAFLRLALWLVPILVVAAVGFALTETPIFAQPTTRLVIWSFLYAYIVCRLITTATRTLASPNNRRLRLVNVSDDGAAFLLRWAQRLSAVAIFGYTFVQVGVLFGLYSIAHDALLRIVSLVVHLMIVLLILQAREPVARRIRARPEASGAFAAFRNRLAATWHWIAIFYAIALWFVWAFEITDGVSRLIRAFIVTALILAFARIIAIVVIGGIERSLGGAEMERRHPTLAARLRSYHPIVRTTFGLLIAFGACVAMLQAWGLDSLGWLNSNPLGGKLMSAILTIVVTILLALLVWEGANAAIERHLDRLTREAQIARSARLRTLLPMLRTMLFAAITVFTGLTVLSEIGINTAPLLAGAGVIGIAIGFGSQRLVQDVITGLFLLLENTMQVGDVVSLGGLSGTVENLSVRTIRLRALDGSVHIVPFSAVTTVTNMTRDYSYALVDISVGLDEEPDRIGEILVDLVRDMRGEARWGSALRDDLEVMGVEKFVDLAWVLRVRVKTLPSQRWAVAREINRRVKYRFDELAIESPFTSHRVLSTNPPPEPAPATSPQPVSAA